MCACLVLCALSSINAPQNYGDVLCNFAERKKADVLVLGHGESHRPLSHSFPHAKLISPPGAGGHTAAKKREVDHETPKLGSVTEHCAAECKCALLITKGEGRWNMGDEAAMAK